MFKLVFVALFCASAYARPNFDYPIDPHVVGGIPAEEGQFPFIVSIREVNSTDSFCGGALITNRYVLTAAHCVKGVLPSEIAVGVGSVNLGSQKIYKVDKVTLHPDYFNTLNTFNDIALVRCSSPILLGPKVQTILPYSNSDDLVGKMVIRMGWGYTSENGPSSEKLMYLKDQPVISNEMCKKLIASKKPIGPDNICAGGEKNHGMCYGDSGSPLAYKGGDGKTYVVGIVSWGIPCAKGYPDVFTRVSYYTNWIKQNIN